MFKLENFSLRKRMYIVAGFGIFLLLLLVLVFWYTENFAIDRILQMEVLGVYTLIGSLSIMGLAHYIGRVGEKHANSLMAGIQNIKRGDLRRSIILTGENDFSWIAFEINSARDNIADLVRTLSSGISQLSNATQSMTAVSKEAVDGMLKQQTETINVAPAMYKMVASVQEVVHMVSGAAAAAKNADNEAKNGKQVILETMGTIDSLAGEVEKTAETLNSLKADIGNIGTIVDVIRGLTEQTNLLALNAAIEVARAGEHGRGFAVVADEIRTLAARTQSSTHKIEEMVARLQSGAHVAVEVMTEGRERATASVEKVFSAGAALDTITTMASTIDEMSAQVSNTVNEQSSVAEGVNSSIVNISLAAEHIAEGAMEASSVADTLNSLSLQLQKSVAKFKV